LKHVKQERLNERDHPVRPTPSIDQSILQAELPH